MGVPASCFLQRTFHVYFEMYKQQVCPKAWTSTENKLTKFTRDILFLYWIHIWVTYFHLYWNEIYIVTDYFLFTVSHHQITLDNKIK